jgi:type II secretory pathway pseudopilin PulG
MKTLLRLLLKSHHQRNCSGPAQTDKGMTLVELLVGSIMAFLIITPMLSFVVDMLNTDRREQVKSNTEQDLQAAVDFIAQDLSQAIYIYDNNPALTSTTTTTPTGIPAIRDQLPKPNNGTPILVFWKQQQRKNSVPINPTVAKTVKPKDCALTSNTGQCNDTYVLSLVAYYQFKEDDKNSIWCQPSGSPCPTRIARYEITDGIKNPDATSVADLYYPDVDTKDSQKRDPAFNENFKLSDPTVDLTKGTVFPNPEVLVNYIDHSQGPILTPCTTALGNPIDPKTEKAVLEETLKVTDTASTPNTNSFYACVDTEKNIARVTIRGNSLRRLQADAKYDVKNPQSPFFPTATVQVKGLGARGN